MYIRPFCSFQYALYVRITTCALLVCISAVYIYKSTLACIKGTRRQEHTSIIQCILRSMYFTYIYILHLLCTSTIYIYVHSVVSNTHTLCTCFTCTFQQSLLLASKDKGVQNTHAYICMHITLPTVHNYDHMNTMHRCCLTLWTPSLLCSVRSCAAMQYRGLRKPLLVWWSGEGWVFH